MCDVTENIIKLALFHAFSREELRKMDITLGEIENITQAIKQEILNQGVTLEIRK